MDNTKLKNVQSDPYFPEWKPGFISVVSKLTGFWTCDGIQPERIFDFQVSDGLCDQGCLPFNGKIHLVWKHVKGMKKSERKIPIEWASVSQFPIQYGGRWIQNRYRRAWELAKARENYKWDLFFSVWNDSYGKRGQPFLATHRNRNFFERTNQKIMFHSLFI